MHTSGPETIRDIYSVSRLNGEVRRLLETNFALLWVEGELSNFARPASGHWYFSLKDDQAQVRCAMFRNRNQLVDLRPRDGMQVLVRARISLYEARGDYQLIVEHMEEAGHGALQRAFEALKHKLSAEGLFDSAHKRPLPDFPKRIGVITSPTGAAIRDVLSVLRRRFPALPVLVYPVRVQGEGAAAEIAAALRLAGGRRDCDALILTRGGGSLEDLWAFNEEVVARAVYECELPVVCGVGHEIDFTIADFVADLRAPTPSAAAELASPSASELAARFAAHRSQLANIIQGRLRERSGHVTTLERRLAQRHPRQRLMQHAQRLDELEQRLRRALRLVLQTKNERLARAELHLDRLSPARRIERLEDHRRGLERRLRSALERRLERARSRLLMSERQLHAFSPLATLNRGYAIVRREDGAVLRAYHQVGPGERVTAQLADGSLDLRVEAGKPGESR